MPNSLVLSENEVIMIAAILAGGKGERLSSVTQNIPKPMVSLAGKPILEYQIENLSRYGVDTIFLLTGYKGEIIENHFANQQNFDAKIVCLQESSPLGTAGCVKELEHLIPEDFFLIYGDIMFNLKLDDFASFHRLHGGAATLVGHPTDHPYDSDLLSVDSNQRILRILNKPHTEKYYGNLGSAALYMLSPIVFSYIRSGSKSDFYERRFPGHAAAG